jgi:CMP-N,N'-diacetyllegionaminic acid synthase
MKMVALIPARAGSKRIPGKNTKPLAGHPLIAYTIAAALESACLSVSVSSDDLPVDYCAERWARLVPASAIISRRMTPPDIDVWVRHAQRA